MKITVLGAGGWGTALARLLSLGGSRITIWGRDRLHLEEMQRLRANAKYLPGIQLPDDWKFEPDLRTSVAGAEAVVIAVPSKVFREVTAGLDHCEATAVSVTKGIEHVTGLTMSAVMQNTMPRATHAVLSGPNIAPEIARGIPAATVVASADLGTAERVQQLFHRPSFRVYTSTDVKGVELGGALKNVIALAAGMCDGLGFGDNTKAALLTRAIVEMRRLGVACGAQPETFSGLSGLGDLTVTCFSRLSRNRAFGERLAKGESVEQVLSSTPTVAEGYPTAKAAAELGRKLRIDVPIIDEVHAVLYEKKDIARAIRDLTARESKPE